MEKEKSTFLCRSFYMGPKRYYNTSMQSKRKGCKRVAAEIMKNRMVNKGFVKCLIAVLAITAAFCGVARAQSMPLDAMMSKNPGPAKRAIGNWRYALMAAGKPIGLQTISVSTEEAVTGTVYRFVQTGDFAINATQSQLLTSTAKMKLDLSLLEYDRSSEVVENGATVRKENIQTVAGTLTVSTTKTADGVPPQSNTIRKPGPVYYAFGAAWVFLHSVELKPGLTATFYSLVPGQDKVLSGRIQVQGMVKSESGAGKVMRVSAFNGESEMLFDVDEAGRVVAYGPATGEVVFSLLED